MGCMHLAACLTGTTLCTMLVNQLKAGFCDTVWFALVLTRFKLLINQASSFFYTKNTDKMTNLSGKLTLAKVINFGLNYCPSLLCMFQLC